MKKSRRDHAEKHRREHQDGLREDDGHDAGVVHAQRHVRALPAVHLAADHPLGVLDGNFSLGLRHRNDARDHEEDHDQQPDQVENAELRHAIHRLEHVDRGLDRIRQAADDADRDDHRNSVADAALGDLFAKPHQQHRAGRHGDDGQQPEAKARVS